METNSNLESGINSIVQNDPVAIVYDLAQLLNNSIQIRGDYKLPNPEEHELPSINDLFQSVSNLINDKALHIVAIDEPQGIFLQQELSNLIKKQNKYKLPNSKQKLTQLDRELKIEVNKSNFLYTHFNHDKEVKRIIHTLNTKRGVTLLSDNDRIYILKIIAQFISEFNILYINNPFTERGSVLYNEEVTLAAFLLVPRNYANFCNSDPLYFMPALYYILLQLDYFYKTKTYKLKVKMSAGRIEKAAGIDTYQNLTKKLNENKSTITLPYISYLQLILSINPEYTPKKSIQNLLKNGTF